LNFGTESGHRSSGSPSGRIADDKFGLNIDHPSSIFVVFDSHQQGARGELPHPFQWLAHRGETRVIMCGNSYVIEPHHRDILAPIATTSLSANSAVEWPPSRKQLRGDRISQLRCGIPVFELNDKLRSHGNAEFLDNSTDSLPTILFGNKGTALGADGGNHGTAQE
jgi:hypothetical protein